MLVIPVINCQDEECVKDRIRTFKKIGSKWVKFDVSDGRFNPVVSWNDPELISDTLSEHNIEVHIMADNPKSYLENWSLAGIERAVIHVESNFDIDDILNFCEENNIELILSKNPTTPVSDFNPFLDKVNYFQFLSVKPGYSGQKFQNKILNEIASLRESNPDVKIEVDGGINENTAKKVKEAGADIIVSSSYIFNSKDPKKAYKKLSNI